MTSPSVFVQEDSRNTRFARSLVASSDTICHPVALLNRRGPSDAPDFRGDSAADLGAAFTGGVSADGLPESKDGDEKQGGTAECPRIAPRRAQRYRLAADWKAHPHFSWVLVRLPAMRCQKLGRNRGDCCITIVSGKAKMEIPVKTFSLSKTEVSRHRLLANVGAARLTKSSHVTARRHARHFHHSVPDRLNALGRPLAGSVFRLPTCNIDNRLVALRTEG
jgi:hypothetical protein